VRIAAKAVAKANTAASVGVDAAAVAGATVAKAKVAAIAGPVRKDSKAAARSDHAGRTGSPFDSPIRLTNSTHVCSCERERVDGSFDTLGIDRRRFNQNVN
jgi:hypothetical protein